jgi:hypothetical protein
MKTVSSHLAVEQTEGGVEYLEEGIPHFRHRVALSVM